MNARNLDPAQRALVCLDAALEGYSGLSDFTREDMTEALHLLSRRPSNEENNAATARLVDALFAHVVGLLPVVSKKTKRNPNPLPSPNERFKVWGRGPYAGIRICGYKNGAIYDRTFIVGDTVEVDSYNHTGTILGIGKTVRCRVPHRSKDDMLSIAEFTWRNYNLDLAEVAARNDETSRYI